MVLIKKFPLLKILKMDKSFIIRLVRRLFQNESFISKKPEKLLLVLKIFEKYSRGLLKSK
jgi:hypothetical protein